MEAATGTDQQRFGQARRIDERLQRLCCSGPIGVVLASTAVDVEPHGAKRFGILRRASGVAFYLAKSVAGERDVDVGAGLFEFADLGDRLRTVAVGEGEVDGDGAIGRGLELYDDKVTSGWPDAR